jgi:hypothetical protein
MATGTSNVTEETQQETGQVQPVSVSARFPEFWPEQARLWFHQIEAIIGPQKLKDDSKYQLLVAKLARLQLLQVNDILASPPAEKKFEALKERLLQVYEESESRQLHQLLEELELGDQKPSQLLRRMKDLAVHKIPDSTLKLLWIARLPQSVRAILAVSDALPTTEMALIADKVMDTVLSKREIAKINNHPNEGAANENFTTLMRAVQDLQTRVEEMSRSKFRERPRYSRFRSSSRGRNEESRNRRENTRYRRDASRNNKKQNDRCYYHHRFGAEARKCREPCNFKSGQSEN